MKYTVQYSDTIDRKAFKKLPLSDKKRIAAAIESKLMIDPFLFGKPLRQSLASCRSLRVGDYRIIYKIHDDCVDILFFGHRSDVYENVLGIL
jgi:mRNA interferase RelE/StbE